MHANLIPTCQVFD